MNQIPIVCDSCGYVATAAEREADHHLENRLVMATCIFSIGVVMFFTHIMTWGSYAFEVPMLQALRFTGMASTASLERMNAICMNLGKYDCVEDTYLQLARTDYSYLERLGIIQVRRSEFKQAAETFRNYLAKGGKSVEAQYQYARALSETGQIDEAAKYYEYVLAARPDVVQTTVIQNYVKMLMNKNRLTEARKVIQAIRTRGVVAAEFMDKEFKEIETRRRGS
jgi:tetratricopeptide (TPR) repeat protein